MQKRKRPAAPSSTPRWQVVVLCALICFAGLETYMLMEAPTPVSTQVIDRQQVISHLMDRTVRVDVGKGYGTGNLVTRKTADGKTIHLVVTAAHVVESLRHEVPGINGSRAGWNPCSVVMPVYQRGSLVGTRSFTARVVQYSNKEVGQDLAILQVEADEIGSATTEFYLGNVLPPVGQDTLHVGCMFGDFHSFTTGVISQHGRRIYGRTFDQTTTLTYPGSSGGGLYLPNGQYVGMASLMRASCVGYITPIREILKWSDRAHCRWVFDPNVKVPSSDKLTAWAVESDGTALPFEEDDAEG